MKTLPQGTLTVRAKPLGQWPERTFELRPHFAGLGYDVYLNGKKQGNIPTQNVKDNLFNGLYELT